MKELAKITKALDGVLPQTMVSVDEGQLLIPSEPLEIRANLKGGDLRFKIGDSNNSLGDSIEVQIFNYKEWQQIQISKDRPKLSDYVQLVGIALVEGKRVFATVTIGGYSAAEAVKQIGIMQISSKIAGTAGMIAKITIEPRKTNGNEWGLTVFESRHADQGEIQDLITLLEQNQDAPNAFRELPDYSKKGAE